MNLRKYGKTIVTLSFFMTLLSCDEDAIFRDEIKSESFNLETYEGQLAYSKFHLTTLAQSVSQVAKDPIFREQLYLQIDRKLTKSEEASVLIEALANLTDANSSNYSKRLKEISTRNNRDFSESLNAFKNVSEYPLYPQIYIPFYETHSTAQAGFRQSNDSSPTIIIGTGDKGQENALYPGYKINEHGELEELDFLISEEYAESNEVWVVSLSDSYFASNEPTVENPHGRVLSNGPDAKILRMKALEHKEEWAYGDSEVHIITVFSTYNYSQILDKHYEGSEYQGGKIRDFSRKDVKNERWKDVNFYILNDWDIKVDNPAINYANYVIFEYDPWPASLRTANYAMNGSSLTREYRSSNSSYYVGTRYKTDFNGFNYSSNDIAYNTEYFDSY